MNSQKESLTRESKSAKPCPENDRESVSGDGPETRDYQVKKSVTVRGPARLDEL
jgi:hypothetical protein